MEFLKVWVSFREVISTLNDAEKGRLFEAMLTYADTGEEPQDFKGNERFLWPVAKQDIDRTALKNETLRANGMKGGRPKKTKDNQTKPEETKENQTEPNESYKEKKDNVYKETLLTECKEKNSGFVPPSPEEVDAYCRERNNGINGQFFVDYYAATGWMVGKSRMKDWKAKIRTWEQNGAPTAIRAKPSQDFPQRDYTGVQDMMMKDLENEVRAFQQQAVI